MLKFNYIGSDTMYNVIFSRISPNILQIKGDVPFDDKGFTVSREGKNDPWHYPEYTTLYKKIEGGLQFSNDESVYVEPEPTSDPEPYLPTPEELEAMFEQNKRDKVLLSKSLLAVYLEEHPITSSARGGVEGVYSVTSEKQSLMTRSYMTYQIKKAADPNAKLRWNEAGKSCEDWTEEEFLQLVLEIEAYVYPLVSYQQTLEEQITACTTQEMLDAIVIDFASVGMEE